MTSKSAGIMCGQKVNMQLLRASQSGVRMETFAQLLSRTRLSASEASDLLGVSADRIAAYEAGLDAPPVNEIQVLKGLATVAEAKAVSNSRNNPPIDSTHTTSTDVHAPRQTSVAIPASNIRGSDLPQASVRKNISPSTSTVGRGKAVTRLGEPTTKHWSDELTSVTLGDSLQLYSTWQPPTAIVSDGAYGVLGFEGDTSDHIGMPEWYEPHIAAWSRVATPKTTLWFWNSEIGWATVHPVLERYGWRYQNANVWDKGLAHIAGNVNTKKIRRFPVVSEMCVQYVYEARVHGKLLKHWLLDEWKRTGLPVRTANLACGVADAAVRKYLDQGHLWYWMPIEMFERLVTYANKYGKAEGRPYFSKNGSSPMSGAEWAQTRSHFDCPHGVTNVWQRGPVHGSERIKVNGTTGRAVHLNQKPLDLMMRIIAASSKPGDVIWEPFGGLFSGSLAARKISRRSFGAELDPTYFQYGVDRLIDEASRRRLL